MKNIYIYLLLSIMLIACVQNKKSSTIFTDETIFDTYNIKIPNVLNKVKEGIWSTPPENKNILHLFIVIEPKDKKDLEEILQELIISKKNDLSENKSFVRRKNLQFENFNGLFEEYNKNANSGIIPVMCYFSYAVLQDDKYTIKISSTSLTKNYISDILHTVKSIRNKGNKINSLGIKIKPNANINKLKEQGYQVFKKDNFFVKCPCNLKINSLFIKMVKERGTSHPVSAYTCADENPETGAIYNIVIHDLFNEFSKTETSKQKLFTKEYLDTYQNNLKINGISNTVKKIQNVVAIEYTFVQMGMPTKAVIFLKNKKSYLLQVRAPQNLEPKFKNFVSSFNFLK